MSRTVVTIAERAIGSGNPCFIIAEAGVNHNGSLELAMRLIDVAAEAGADAVKFQTYKAESVMTGTAPKATYQRETTDASESQLDMARRLELPFEAFDKLQAHCRDRQIVFLSSPFDHESIDYLDQLGVPAMKVPSGEITNWPFLAHVGRTGRPIILSTGMSTLGEVDQGLRAIYATGNRQVVLLHCVSNYPTNARDVNLRAMATMGHAFQLPVGFSDHTIGIEIALAAVALDATVIEKHITLDKTLPGPDHRASLEPHELTALVTGVRTVELALGDGRKEPAASELDTAMVARRSIVSSRDIAAGTVLTPELLAIKRPGTGLPPAMLPHLLGRSVREDVAQGALLDMSMLA